MNKETFKDKLTAMRTALDEAKKLLAEKQIDLYDYKKLITILLLEVNELDETLKKKEIENILFKVVNQDT
ncbi:hypothetical protein [Aquimarina rhabdastrellae]